MNKSNAFDTTEKIDKKKKNESDAVVTSFRRMSTIRRQDTVLGKDSGLKRKDTLGPHQSMSMAEDRA